MIDYSVYMQSNPFDETAAPKAYAKAQMRELMTFAKFINHISKHNGVYSRGTVRGVVIDMCECLVEQLLEGKKIQLGELGSFWLSLTSEGAETMDDFTAANIKAVNIIFTPGADFENLIEQAEFNVVASRIAQAATLKAEKSGATTVDLEAARAAARNTSGNGSSSTTSGSGSTETGSGSTTSGSGSSSTEGGSTEGGGDNTDGGDGFNMGGD